MIRSFSSFLRRYRRARSGATAVEFALIAGPFFFLLFALMEIAAIFFVGAVLENAMLETARDIRTGAAQGAGMSRAGFTAAICDRIAVIGNCDQLEVDVKVFNGFGDVQQDNPINPDGSLNTGGMDFEPGDAGDIVLVRVYYKWEVILPDFGGFITNMENNQRLVTAATVFRNEPFDD